MLTLNLTTSVGNFELPDGSGGTTTLTGGTAIASMIVQALCTHFQHDESDDSLDGTIDVALFFEVRAYDTGSSLVATIPGAGGALPLTLTVNSSFVPGASTGAAIANAFFDATGVRIREAPMTPARVRAVLAAAGK